MEKNKKYNIRIRKKKVEEAIKLLFVDIGDRKSWVNAKKKKITEPMSGNIFRRVLTLSY